MLRNDYNLLTELLDLNAALTWQNLKIPLIIAR